MTTSPFPISRDLTAIAIAYRNPDYIADSVVPRIRVNKQEFTFLQYATDTFFNAPDTFVGRRSKPNQVELSASEVTDKTEDHALDGGVPGADTANADDRYDPLGDEVALLQEFIALRREMRAAGIVFNPATYDPALRTVLAGNSQLSDPSSDPISAINDALDKPLLRPTQMVFGQRGWTKFRSHPVIVEAALGTGAKKGAVSRQAVAELFEVKEVIVGSARGNSARRGQAPALARLWGNHLALTYKAPVITKDVPTFAATFEFGDRVAGSWFDKDMGMRGGTVVRTGESVKERVVASQAGYFFENAFG